MRKLISERLALNTLLAILFMLILFHSLIMLNVIPFGAVWGGKMKDQSQMLMFETVSIIINLFMVGIFAIRAGYLNININQRVLRIIIWIIFSVFVINSLGNILSVSPLEKALFTPITLILSILSLRVALMNTNAS